MTNNLENYTVKQLNVIAKDLGLIGYSKLRKQELINFIKKYSPHVETPQVGTPHVETPYVGTPYVGTPHVGTPYVGTPHVGTIDKCKYKTCIIKDICNPKSGRCVSKKGNIGKKLLKEDEWFIFTIDSCPSCKKAKELFNLLRIKYKQIEVKESEKTIIFSELKELTNDYKYFPIIFKNGIFIGGYDKLNEMFTPRPDISKIHMINPTPVLKTHFAGQPWEDLVSMLYLMYRHQKECVAIPLDLLTNSGKLTTKAQKVKQFFDTSLEWSEKRNDFIVPIGLWTSVKSCLAKGSKFIVMPFGFSCISGLAHANFLVYNSHTKELERFDPHGLQIDCFNPPGFAKKLGQLFNNNVQKDMIVKVYDPLDFCPIANVQYIQEKEKEQKIDDPRGFCLAWSAWYADTRLSNPNKSRIEVVNMALKELKDRPTSFTTFIRSYSGFLEKIGNELKKGKTPGDVFAKHIQKYT
jgi:glutaredoxin